MVNKAGKFKVPQIDASRLGRGYILRAGKRSAQEHVWPVFEAIGEKRFEQLIDNNYPFFERIPEDKVPEKWGEWIMLARYHTWALLLVREEDYLTFLPGWLAGLITRDTKSRQWFANEVNWLKSQITEGNKKNG